MAQLVARPDGASGRPRVKINNRGLAQLVARLLWEQEAASSSLASPTNLNNVKYIDRVYGEFQITEPVILELINCPTLQRLKDIDQAGYRPLWVKSDVDTGEYDHSRFAHSLGVYLLLRKHNVSPEEQIAGLIHDVSHSAFSHCVEYILEVGSEKEHNHQDNLFDSYVRKTEIPEIINKFSFDLEYILNDKNFPLKEKKLPDLCADRIDYSLKTAVIFGELNERDKNYLLENLTTENNNWVY